MYTKIHKFNFIASVIIAVVGAYLFISSGDATGKLAGKALLVAGAVGQLYHVIAIVIIGRKHSSSSKI